MKKTAITGPDDPDVAAAAAKPTSDVAAAAITGPDGPDVAAAAAKPTSDVAAAAAITGPDDPDVAAAAAKPTSDVAAAAITFMTAEDKEKMRLLQEEIDLLDSRVSIASENGMFGTNQKDVPRDSFYKIQDYLRSARKCLYSGNITEADYVTSLALQKYNDALYSTRRRWRFTNVYAGNIWIYLVAFLTAILAFYFSQMDKSILNDLNVKIQSDALYAASWGAVGGILRGLWYLKERVSDRKYSNSYRIYFLSVPFLGGLFGAVMYFSLLAGVLIVGGELPTSYLPAQETDVTAANPETANTTAANPETANTTAANPETANTTAANPETANTTAANPETANTTAANPETANTSSGTISSWAIILFAILAGFNWEWAVMILKRIGDSFKETTEPMRKMEK